MTNSHAIRSPIDVAAAIVQRADGRVLLTERPPGKPWAGYWEFPGGKIEAGEAPQAALRRELHEELGIELEAANPWITFVYTYPEKAVRLHFFRVDRWHGQPQGREGQRLAWEDPAAVQAHPLLPANARVVQALNLPAVYAISQAGRLGITEFMKRLRTALERGLRLIQVREHELTAAERTSLAREVVELAHRHGARVLINGDEDLANRVGADGVHLPSRQLMQRSTAPPGPMWAASCHDAEQLDRAARLGATLAVLSSVLPTASHPGEPGMGWDRFEARVRNCPVPVYALGGMKLELLDTARRHGAHGVALLSGIWTP